MNVAQKIEEFTEELFVDLGLTMLPEEKKADIFARVEEHFRRAIIGSLRALSPGTDLSRLERALAEERTELLDRALRKYPQHRQAVENKIEEELQKLKLIIAEEQKNGQAVSSGEAARGAAGAVK